MEPEVPDNLHLHQIWIQDEVCRIMNLYASLTFYSQDCHSTFYPEYPTCGRGDILQHPSVILKFYFHP